MKLLVGFLTIMVLGGLLGTDEWNWGLSTDGQDLDSDSTWMSIQCNNSAMDDSGSLKADSDSIILEEYISPIIRTSEKPMKSFYRYKKERNAEFSSRCHFSFSVDFPKSTVKNGQLIRSWLAERAVKTLSKNMPYNVKDYSDQQIEKYTSSLFFSFKEAEFSTDDTVCYPIEAFFELNLQSILVGFLTIMVLGVFLGTDEWNCSWMRLRGTRTIENGNQISRVMYLTKMKRDIQQVRLICHSLDCQKMVWSFLSSLMR